MHQLGLLGLSLQNENVRFHGWPGPHGHGANRFEPTRTGPIESVARGKAEASDAGRGGCAAESNRPPGTADAALPSRTRRYFAGSRTTRSAIEPQASFERKVLVRLVHAPHKRAKYPPFKGHMYR